MCYLFDRLSLFTPISYESTSVHIHINVTILLIFSKAGKIKVIQNVLKIARVPC